jgi:cobalt-precorrin 5A hydrolase
VDILGRELGWQLERKENVTPVSAAVVNEKPVAFVQETGEANWWTRPTPLPKNVRRFSSLAEALAAGEFEAYLVVTDRSLVRLQAELSGRWPKTVVYRPKSLCLGMGCDYGSTQEELEDLLVQTLESAGLSPKSIAGLASIDLKADEACLNGLAARLGLKLELFTKEELNEKKTKSMPNPLVMKYTGAVGVCEPAAMLLAGVGDLVVAKHKSQKATLAIARKDFGA